MRVEWRTIMAAAGGCAACSQPSAASGRGSAARGQAPPPAPAAWGQRPRARPSPASSGRKRPRPREGAARQPAAAPAAGAAGRRTSGRRARGGCGLQAGGGRVGGRGVRGRGAGSARGGAPPPAPASCLSLSPCSRPRRARAAPQHPAPRPTRTLRLVVVHAVLARQRLDQVLERGVAPHIVGQPDCLLHPQQHRGEGGVEALQVIRQLVHHRPQLGLCKGGVWCERREVKKGASGSERHEQRRMQWRCAGAGAAQPRVRAMHPAPQATHPSSRRAAHAGCR